MKPLLIITSILFSLSCLSDASAQNADKPWSLGLMAGNNAYLGDLGSSFDSDQPFQAFGGIHLNRYLSPRWDLSLEGTRGCHGVFQWDRNAFLNSMTNIDLSAIYKLGAVGSAFQPFLHAGLGFNSHKAMEDGRGPADAILDFGIPLGLGIRVGLGKSADIFWKGTYGLNFGDDYDLSSENQSGNDHFLQNALGIQFNFGAPAVVKFDRDGDGVTDAKDRCPDEPGRKEFDGCTMSEADMAAKLAMEAEAERVRIETERIAREKREEAERVAAEAAEKARVEAQMKAEAEAKQLAEAEKAAEEVKEVEVEKAVEKEVAVKGDQNQDGRTYTGATGRGIISRTKGSSSDIGSRGYAKDDTSYEERVEVYAGERIDETVVRSSSNYPDLEELFRRARYEVKFNSGSSTISSVSYGILGEIISKLNTYGDLSIVIEGHTDSQGEADSNLALSRNRANAVLNYLATRGVTRGLLSATGYGETSPIGDNATSEGRRQNRRVEIRIR